MPEKPTDVRVRFAPSPTGTLHVGGARSAIFNWLFARSVAGVFIVRIEDTDRARYDATAEASILEDLRWLGMDWDEGPGSEGPYGPYRQSQRLEGYRTAAARLLEAGEAYRCFCTPGRLAEVRERQSREKARSGYDGHCRDLDPGQGARRAGAGEAHVVRLKAPRAGVTGFHDRLRGRVEMENAQFDDLILLKSDGFPSYHLASVVDDHRMRISHVLRGEEWIPSTPKHVLLYRALGWPQPEFVHLPVILSATGGKLSKRKGALSVGDYRERGLLPAALFNFLALLGWNPGDDQELMLRDDLVSRFSLDRVHPKSCYFDEKKLDWMNRQYLRQCPADELLGYLHRGMRDEGLDPGDFEADYLLRVLSLMRERISNPREVASECGYFFRDPQGYDAAGEKKFFTPGAKGGLESLRSALSDLEPFDAGAIEAVFRGVQGELGLEKLGPMVHPVRLAATGVCAGPGLFDLLQVLGRERVLRRFDVALARIA